MSERPAWIAVHTGLAMVAFAGNSVLCRAGLGGDTIDAASFTIIRLASGAVTLFLIVSALNRKGRPKYGGNWISAAMLFLYAVTFSFAYLHLSTGTGALILFGAVQVTMIMAALWSGERPGVMEWSGMVIALSGLVYLLLPGLTAPSPTGAALMAAAGISWGVYSLRGRTSINPLTETAGNFVRSVPFAVIVSLVAIRQANLSVSGVLLAATSGALASGVGYAIWYTALKGLSATRAAAVQLSVPVLAAGAGVVFLAETVSVRLVLSAALILGGIGLAVAKRPVR